jgi:heme-degrading monooxygenase HmoA
VRVGTLRNILREDDPMNRIANTPKPPYYAVIFTSFLHDGCADYAAVANSALELAKQQPGFLGYEGVRNGMGISVSYWDSLDAIRAWKEHPDHVRLQKQEKRWFRESKIRISKVERDY